MFSSLDPQEAKTEGLTAENSETHRPCRGHVNLSVFGESEVRSSLVKKGTSWIEAPADSADP